MASHSHSKLPGQQTSHVTPVSQLVATYFFLLIMLILTVAVNSVDLGFLNIIVAMVIAVGKAGAVIWIFMGVNNGTRLTWLWASIGFIWLLLLFGTLGDYLTRLRVIGWTP